MAGTIEPIAALTADDRGPINTIVSIVLPSISILFSVIRIVVRQQRHLSIEIDDIVYGVTLCFAITSSVVSHFCVRAGLGRHQNTLGHGQVVHYFKLFWTTQLLGIVALAGAKLSVVLMFQRIDPLEFGRMSRKWLTPMVGVYMIIALFLVAFQCKLPGPWVYDPDHCLIKGDVYKVTTVFNIITDSVLSFCIIPFLWKLQMNQHTKMLLMWLFVSRFVVCIADMGRISVIHRAVQSEDQTRSQLLWAIMDQVVIHLSVNHATVPRIQIFLSNLQTGLLHMQVPATHSHTRDNPVPRRKANGDGHSPDTKLSRWRKSNQGRWSSLRTQLSTMDSASKTPSISEHPLRLEPESGIEMSTTICAGDGESKQSDDNGGRQDPPGPAKLPSERLTKDRLRIHKEFKIAYNRE